MKSRYLIAGFVLSACQKAPNPCGPGLEFQQVDLPPQRIEFCVDQDGRKQGAAATFEGERKVESTTMVDGEPHGQRETFWPNGKTKTLARYRSGLLHGLTEGWTEGGLKVLQVEYKLGKKSGLDQVFYESGQVKEQTSYAAGQRDGFSTTYDPNGKVLSKTEYRAGAVVEPPPEESPVTDKERAVINKLSKKKQSRLLEKVSAAVKKTSIKNGAVGFSLGVNEGELIVLVRWNLKRRTYVKEAYQDAHVISRAVLKAVPLTTVLVLEALGSGQSRNTKDPKWRGVLKRAALLKLKATKKMDSEAIADLMTVPFLK